MARTPVALVILDGWGLREETAFNAIAHARTPVWDRLIAHCPTARLSASGTDVGLPVEQMGNSEVGHLTLGAGRTIHQDLTRIDNALADGTFASNATLERTLNANPDGTLHILGLLSPGGVHSHENQIVALLEAAADRRRKRVRLHAFLDGRDTPPKSAAASLDRVEARFPGVTASITGRYYAMDRDQRWERTAKAYRLLVEGRADHRHPSAAAALAAAYARGESDEFVEPTAIQPEVAQSCTIETGDTVVFMNFRADRARQLTRALVWDEFDAFPRGPKVALAMVATLTRYADDLDVPAIFGPVDLSATIGEVVSSLGKRQLRLAETEKYAHVTYFFSGGREAPFAGEERTLVPSPKVPTYDLAPEMSAAEVTARLTGALRSGQHDLLVCNYANGDMVGHTGDFGAALRAVETIDASLGQIVQAVNDTGGHCLITADHGNVEQMRARNDEPHTAHTTEAVPLVYVGDLPVSLRGSGTLADVAPTLLELMGIPQPDAMTGRSMLASQTRRPAATQRGASVVAG